MARTDEVEHRIGKAFDDVVSLDHDRILRSYLTAMKATLRTNYFQADGEGKPKPYISFKIVPTRSRTCRSRGRSSRSSSTRVEGVHLRFGAAHEAACAGRTAATTSAPRSSAW